MIIGLAVGAAAWLGAEALENMTVNGLTRSMLVHVPQELPENAALVIACHGMNQDANWHKSNSAWTQVADTAKFVVVFPNGVDKGWDLGGSKDTDFMIKIIDEMESRYGISRNRVYLTGFSMGGMFTYFCANRIPDYFAAFCPVSGYPMGDKSATSSRPVPIFHTHGTGDDVCVFSGVQPTLDNWIKRNGCNTTAVVTRPASCTNPYTNPKIHTWKDGLDGVEVCLFELPDKGHWQSEDTNFGLTSIEAWNFMRRWSLGPDAPKVVTVTPEDKSFDLPASGLEITVEFNEPVKADGATARLAGYKGACDMTCTASGNTLRLAMPAGTTLPAGEYELTVRNVTGEAGGEMKLMRGTYALGYEEVTAGAQPVTHYAPNWRAEQNSVGEGIPTGWHRLHYSNDRQDEKGSGSANTGSARMKYFPTSGGDFAEGFYLSARDYDKCEISYGRYDGHRLHLPAGKITASFNSVYWNEGSMSGKSAFNFTVSKTDGTTVATFPSLPSSGNLNENSSMPITDSYRHKCEFAVPAEGDYIITWSMTQGWAAVIVGNLAVADAASLAQLYKGTYLDALARAKALYDSLDPNKLALTSVTELYVTICDYDNVVSTSPTVYENATAALLEAVARAERELSGVSEVTADGCREVVETTYYNLMGQPIAVPAGVHIRLDRYSDGTSRAVKMM